MKTDWDGIAITRRFAREYGTRSWYRGTTLRPSDDGPSTLVVFLDPSDLPDASARGVPVGRYHGLIVEHAQGSSVVGL